MDLQSLCERVLDGTQGQHYLILMTSIYSEDYRRALNQLGRVDIIY